MNPSREELLFDLVLMKPAAERPRGWTANALTTPLCATTWKQCCPRKVALKIIKLGMDTKQVVARFEAGRQALAMMDHQNIAKVLDAVTIGEGDRNADFPVGEATEAGKKHKGRLESRPHRPTLLRTAIYENLRELRRFLTTDFTDRHGWKRNCHLCAHPCDPCHPCGCGWLRFAAL